MLVPLLLAALLAGVKGGDIADRLRGDARTELDAAGFGDIDVEASGRDLTLSAPDGALSQADLDRAQSLVEGVDGVRVASLADDVEASAGTGDDETDDGTDGGTDDGTDGGTSEGADASCDATTLQGTIDAALGDDFVQFGEASADPDAGSQAELAEVAAAIAPCTDLTVTVTGYTDKNGTQKRSLQRAENVATLLTDAGVTAAIEPVGGHFDQALGDNETAAGRDMNRFATITVQ